MLIVQVRASVIIKLIEIDSDYQIERNLVLAQEDKYVGYENSPVDLMNNEMNPKPDELIYKSFERKETNESNVNNYYAAYHLKNKPVKINLKEDNKGYPSSKAGEQNEISLIQFDESF